jgi:hypothetical protein
MSAFSMIESFFFLSLGITFVLIILLIYHFKQRITTIEQKSDTMFDIVQNLAKELNSMKVQNMTNGLKPNYVNAILKEEHDYEEEEEQEESEEEDEEEESDDEEEEEEDGEEEEGEEEGEASVRVSDFVAKAPANNYEYEGGVRGAKAPAMERVKIINISDLEQIDQIQENIDDSESESEEPVELKDDDSDKIKVLKMSASVDIASNPAPVSGDQSIHVYKKMTVGALKSLVISKGLCSDTSKLSKRELLQLLTNK